MREDVRSIISSRSRSDTVTSNGLTLRGPLVDGWICMRPTRLGWRAYLVNPVTAGYSNMAKDLKND